jgi:hypothetical protein
MADWNKRCAESIRKEKTLVEAKYGIRIGQTEIYCARCGKPWGFGGHVCQGVRFQKLNAAKKKPLIKTPELVSNLKRVGAKKASAMLYIEKDGTVVRDVTESNVRSWIKRGNVPRKYRETVDAL